MLQFSHVDRISAKTCLESPYFDDVRKKECEEPASHGVNCPNRFIDEKEAAEFLAREINLLNK